MIEIESVETHTEATVRIRLNGTPKLKADYTDRQIQPFNVAIIYAYRQSRSELDGWLEHHWVARSVTVTGLRVLRPGKDGAQRLGKDVHKASWAQYGPAGNVQSPDAREPLPEWLDKLITELRPSGDLSVAGAA